MLIIPDSVIKACVALGLFSAVATFILAPFAIGKERTVFKAEHWLFQAAIALAVVILAGRAMGWW